MQQFRTNGVTVAIIPWALTEPSGFQNAAEAQGYRPKYPIADSLSPVDTQNQISKFSFTFTSQLACGEGTPTVIVAASNGVLQSSLSDTDASSGFTSTPGHR